MKNKKEDQFLKELLQKETKFTYIGEVKETKAMHAALQMAEVGHLVMTSVSGLLKPVVIDKKKEF